MVVHPSFPPKTVPEFIAYTRATQARPHVTVWAEAMFPLFGLALAQDAPELLFQSRWPTNVARCSLAIC